MANTPSDLSYTKDHTWVRRTGDSVWVGITDHAQRQLGDVVFVELPDVGHRFEVTEVFGTVESVKAVSELYAPVSGTVTAVNDLLSEEPEQINGDPYGDGWVIEIRTSNPAELNDLLTAAEYEAYIREEEPE